MDVESIDLIKEKETCEDAYVFKILLRNNVTIYISEKGYGEGTDGERYYPVLKEIKENIYGVLDSNLKVIGWSYKIKKEIIL